MSTSLLFTPPEIKKRINDTTDVSELIELLPQGRFDTLDFALVLDLIYRAERIGARDAKLEAIEELEHAKDCISIGLK